MKHLPIFLDIKDRPVLVIGGSEMAARKVEAILKAEARITVVAEDMCPALSDLVSQGAINHKANAFEDSDLDGVVLVFVATDDEDLNKRASSMAKDAGIPVNVVDRFELCSFIMPAVIDRSPMLVAVSSGGDAPIIARVLKARLETFIPAGLGRLAEFAGACRGRVKDAINEGPMRLRFWEHFINGPIAEYILAGQEEAAENLLSETLANVGGNEDPAARGEVYLVGSGPGDPDLLTFRALRLMQQADVVLHDRLVTDEIMELVRRDAERIFVGKRRGDHAMPQEEIGLLMVRLAKEGKRGLRLKSGDPFVFGRGGEEIDALSSEGIHFQVVPGVTAANGCASYAGIPLTHRDHAQSCIFVTGHAKDENLDLDWPTLVRPSQTLVVYMGLDSLPMLTEKLISHGTDPKTPAAIVDNGTRPGQRVVTAPLEDLARRARDENLPGPSIIIIGSVVTLRDRLSWFKPASVNREEVTSRLSHSAEKISGKN
ncbi:MAG: uroporphyrinogen-III C-methyltransferase [Alphaproteobacteria bacterium]|nr:uroporphyrinogen-III C-methyltransferase [Alphaproteobacteria bacterium]